MIHYIALHGQATKPTPTNSGILPPTTDLPLSDLGREQARLLGNRMKKLGFHGKIVSSPYLQTMETAQIIAEITDTSIIPSASMREPFGKDGNAYEYRGTPIEILRERFFRIAPSASLPYPWWEPSAESAEKVRNRVRSGYDLICEKYPDEELLFIGHTASVSVLTDLLGISSQYRTVPYHCSLSAIDRMNPDFVPFRYDASHLLYEITTNDFVSREECDAEYFKTPFSGEIPIPDLTDCREKILHIGDTRSDRYPYYRRLFELVKPDVILHTGDMADEVKVGRIPGTEYEYISKIRVLLEMMKATGARLLIVPGNNDLPEEIRKIAPEAEILNDNEEVLLSGVPCRVGHWVGRMTFDKKYALYGHGLTGETWSYEKNADSMNRRFNVMWGSFLYDLQRDLYWRFPLPYTG